MRTTKNERKENAQRFYQLLISGASNQTAIVINRMQSSNPNINRCQFLSVIGLAMSRPVIIAESTLGINGCFDELLRNINNDIKIIPFYSQGFNEWLKKEFHMDIIYQDGLVFMIERTH